MTAKSYLNCFSAFAHWKFPAKDADGIVEDYRDFFSDTGASSEPLTKRLGNPTAALRQLGIALHYRLWLVVFSLFVLCMGILSVDLFTNAQERRLDEIVTVVGLALVVFWFLGTKNRPKQPGSKIILLIIFALAIFVCVEGLLLYIASRTTSLYWAKIVHISVPCIGLVSAIIGIFGLVMARIYDRRWRALYTFAMMVVMLSLLMLSILHSMEPYDTPQALWVSRLFEGGVLLAAGLTATAVSLC